MNLRDNDQRKIIESIRNGDEKLRENYIIHYYERIKGNLIRLHIPEEYHEDILHDCIITVMNVIDEIDLEKQSYVCQIFHVQIVAQIAKSLSRIYTYTKEINGKTYNNPSKYLRNKDVKYTNYDVIEEYLNNGELPEKTIIDTGTSLRDTEERVINRELKDAYWDYVSNLSPLKQDIITGRMPVDDTTIESCGEIAKRNNCTRAYIHQESIRQKKLLLRNSKLKLYLK